MSVVFGYSCALRGGGGFQIYLTYLFFFSPDRFNAIMGVFFFFFSLFDARSYVSYEDFYMGRFKDYREGVGFSVLYLFSFLERGSYIGFGVFKRKVSTFLGFSLIDLEEYRQIWK